ncbi:TetR family transcriptional regulator [Bradyrhizobium sp. AUGA SZCCT0182]|uniref:TetR family transcriptional regulator n=1 Tax=Bradyrhizobium sp. AUGA SZCCT0182 TaxID=2807667 RepID=UPI00390CD700
MGVEMKTKERPADSATTCRDPRCGLRGIRQERLRGEDVAARASATKGTIHFYFETKERVFHEMIRHSPKASYPNWKAMLGVLPPRPPALNTRQLSISRKRASGLRRTALTLSDGDTTYPVPSIQVTTREPIWTRRRISIPLERILTATSCTG